MILFMLATAVLDPGLDSPVVPARPTIRSEIHRGMDAAWECREPDLLTHMQRYQDCIEAAQSANRQRMGSAFEAFDVGLYRIARDTMAEAVSIVAGSPPRLFDLDIAKAELGVEEAGYQQSRKAVGLSEPQVDIALKP